MHGASFCAIELTNDDNISHTFLSTESNLEIQRQGKRECLGKTYPVAYDYAHFYWITLTVWTNETSFIITEILIPPKYPAVYFL